MGSSAKEAREHLEQAEKALKPSFLSFKFSPDYMVASIEYTQAATKFRAAGMMAESLQAWMKSAEAKEQISDLFGAGRAYESAGAICESGSAGGPSASAGHWRKAVRCFRLCGKGDAAAKLILKLAELQEKQGDAEGAKAAYEEAIEVHEQDEKDYNLSDVYKQYTAFLVRSGAYGDAARAIDGHVAVLVRQKHLPFVYKELLAKVVLHLHTRDTVRAEEALNPATDVQGWYASAECQAGSELVAAFQQNDPEEAARVLKQQIFTFLQIEVARLAKQLRIAAPAAAPRAAATGTGEEERDPLQQEEDELDLT